MGPVEYAFLAIFVAIPVLTLAHELGHAVVALLATSGPVELRVGQTPGWVKGRAGRLSFELSAIPAKGAFQGDVRAVSIEGKAGRVVFALAGLAAEVVVLAIALPAIALTDGALHTGLVVAWAVSALLLFVNLVPIRSGDFVTDGRSVLDALRPESLEDAIRHHL